MDVVEKAADDRGVPRLIEASRARGGDLPSGAEVAPLFGNAPADRQLAAAFEMAVWDAELRAAGLSMAQALGDRTRVRDDARRRGRRHPGRP